MFDIVIINDDLEKAYEELKEILNEVCAPQNSGFYRFVFLAQVAVFSFLSLQEIKKVQEAK